MLGCATKPRQSAARDFTVCEVEREKGQDQLDSKETNLS